MYTFIYKKIVKFSDQVSAFVRQNLTQIVIIVSLFVVLEIIKSFPYINIIPNYQFLVIGFILLLGVILLRFSIPNRKIISGILFLFVIASFLTIFDIKPILDLIGFVIFILLLLIVGRKMILEKDDLRENND